MLVSVYLITYVKRLLNAIPDVNNFLLITQLQQKRHAKSRLDDTGKVAHLNQYLAIVEVEL